MRADRLLSIMLLLQVHRRQTAAELAEKLEVSPRTIQRDMESLSMAGVPVTADRGAGGGWSLMEGYQTNLTGLTKQEAQALLLGTPAHVTEALGLGDATQGALIKLLATLPGLHRRDASYMRERIHIDGAGWFAAQEKAPCLTELQEVLWQDQRAVLHYERPDGEAVERLVDPLGLVVKGTVWYLIAAVEGEMRTYRVSRIGKVQPVDEPCRRPPHFHLPSYWAASAAALVAGAPRFAAAVRADPAVLPKLRMARKWQRVESVGDPGADGWVDVEMSFEVMEEAVELCLAHGPSLEVLEPQELRELVVSAARKTLERYGL